MKQQGYLLNEICRVLDCKVHHIRYIEERLPIISTAFDSQGRRIYTLRDIHLLSRILHLTRFHSLGLDEAVDRLLSELDGNSIDTAARFLQLRHELIRTRLQSIQSVNRLSLGGGAAPGNLPSALPDSGAEDTGSRLVHNAGAFASAARHPLSLFSPQGLFPGDCYDDLEADFAQFLGGEGRPSAISGNAEVHTRPDATGFSGDSDSSELASPAGGIHEKINGILAAGRWLVLTPDPYRSSPDGRYPGTIELTPVRGLSVLEYLAEKIVASANALGNFPIWVISVRKKHFYSLYGYLQRNNFLSIPPDRIVLLPQPDVNSLSNGDAAALFTLQKSAGQRINDEKLAFGQILSMEQPMVPLADREALEQLLGRGLSWVHASLPSVVRGELYFSLPFSRRVPAAMVNTRQLNFAGEAADTSERSAIVLNSAIEPVRRLIRPFRWEFFPPLYYRDRFERDTLREHMVRTWSQWRDQAGITGGRSAEPGNLPGEISPLYAADRDEFFRRNS